MGRYFYMFHIPAVMMIIEKNTKRAIKTNRIQLKILPERSNRVLALIQIHIKSSIIGSNNGLISLEILIFVHQNLQSVDLAVITSSKWRKKSKNLFGLCLPIWLLSALYTLFDKKQSENSISFTEGYYKSFNR